MYSGWAAGKFGRKWIILSGGVPLLVGWILIATADNIIQIYAARVIFGLVVGQLFAVVPIYVGEIAEVIVISSKLSEIYDFINEYLKMDFRMKSEEP